MVQGWDIKKHPFQPEEDAAGLQPRREPGTPAAAVLAQVHRKENYYNKTLEKGKMFSTLTAILSSHMHVSSPPSAVLSK